MLILCLCVVAGADDVSGAIGGVIRQMPGALLSPLIKVTEGASALILGARNQLTPEARKQDKEKYKDNVNKNRM